MLKFIWIISIITLPVEGDDFPPYENIALNKPANQSSEIEEFSPLPASRANDGNRTNIERMEMNSCIHTKYKDSPRTAWWSVDLGFISFIHELGIIYRDWTIPYESSDGRLAGFSVYVSNNSNFMDGTKCFSQSEEGGLPSVSTTAYPCLATGQFISVYNERLENVTYPTDYSNYAVLELCEVEVPGCRKETFGVNCNRNCFCKRLTCDYISGKCNGGCETGYTGVSCNETCPAGSFGDACLQSCPHCAGDQTCDNTGKCTHGCEVGYFADDYLLGCPNKCGNCQGVRCDEGGRCPGQCVPGFYSDNCSRSCPTNCIDRYCVQDTGICMRCSDGYFGNTCEEHCPANCANDACYFETGHCKDCKSGWHGDSCVLDCKHCGECYHNGTCMGECESGYTKDQTGICVSTCSDCDDETEKGLVHSPITYLVIGAGSGISLVLVIIAIIAILYRRKRHEKKSQMELYCKTDRRNHSDEEHVYDHVHTSVTEERSVESKQEQNATTNRGEDGPSSSIIYSNISGNYYNQSVET